MSDYFSCPHCGFELKPGALSCPHCGSDENTGWSDNTIYDGIDLPEPAEEPRRKFVVIQDLKILIALIIIFSLIWITVRF